MTEEEIILAVHKKILENYLDALLIWVPPHPNRFDAVAHLIEQQALRFFADEAYRKKVGANAFNVIDKNRGAMKNNLS